MNQMSVATFDTLAAVRNLEKAGMGTSQAEAVTETIRVAVFQGVATKEDLADQRGELKADIGEVKAEIAKLRGELKADIGEVKAEIAKLRGELKADIGEVKAEIAELRAATREDLAELRTELEKLRADLTWRMVLAVGTLLAIFAALDRFVLN